MAREELKWQNIDADDLPAAVKKSFDAMVEAEATFKADLEKLLKNEGHMPEDKFLVMSRKGKRLSSGPPSSDMNSRRVIRSPRRQLPSSVLLVSPREEEPRRTASLCSALLAWERRQLGLLREHERDGEETTEMSALRLIMASAVLFERHPLERTVRWRTVANELSMTLVVRRCFQCSAGKS
jgi:hypothetical protein